MTICTVHRAKGCEWPVVFIPGLTDEIFPAPEYYRDYTWEYVPMSAIADAERYENNIENEDRLFYVAMTRSQKFLHFTRAPPSTTTATCSTGGPDTGTMSSGRRWCPSQSPTIPTGPG